MSGPADGGVRYEKQDAEAGPVFHFGLWLVLGMGVSAAIVLGVFLLLQRRELAQDPPPPPLAWREAGRLPPAPRLQTAPIQDLAAMREESRKLLEGDTAYGWVDEKAGLVRIPIDEAMKIVAERGLPAAAPAPVVAASPAPAASPSPVAVTP